MSFFKKLGGAWWFSTWSCFFLPSDDALRWILALLDLKMVCWDLRLERWSHDFPRMHGRYAMSEPITIIFSDASRINPQKWWHFCWVFDNFLPKKRTHKYDFSYLLFFPKIPPFVGFLFPPRLYAHPGCHGPIMTWLRWISFPYGWEWTKRCWDEVIFEELRNRFWQITFGDSPSVANRNTFNGSTSTLHLWQWSTWVLRCRNELEYGWPMFPLRCLGQHVERLPSRSCGQSKLKWCFGTLSPMAIRRTMT